MNLNSLVIAADASSARLFRTGQTNHVEEPVELIQIDQLEPAAQEPGLFARQIAERVARFAELHLCNPIIIAATSAMSPVLTAEIEREVPRSYVRPVVGDWAELPVRQLMDDLRERGAFSAVHYSCQT